jgi:diguanylate cyclase (GGDEF)-like protein
VDLDRFRDINGVLGHENGDRLLVVVARRLRALLRPSDLLARISGDVFAVLLRDAGPGRAELLASRLREVLRAPVLLSDMPVRAEVSVGIAYAPAHGRAAAELLRHAEAAMYEAKQTRVGQRTYQRSRHAPAAPGRARLRLRAELRGALEADQIELRYQPKADPRTGRVSGVEALVRWQHPREGLRGPGVFLLEMEQAGMMPALTRRVLDLALADCARWHAAGQELSVSVNVPPSVIDDQGFAQVVRDALRRHELAPSALVIEVTEEALITVREQARRTLAELRALGVRVSLDDYGTGFCSLAYLRELPADEVKLDQMFLRDMHRDASAAEIVRSTVALAHALDLKIVAEGVETRTAWAALASWRCDEVQGYYVSPPLTGNGVLAWLSDWARRVAHAQAARRSQAAGGHGRQGAGARGVDGMRARPAAGARNPAAGTAEQMPSARPASAFVPAQPGAKFSGPLGVIRPAAASPGRPPG